MNEQTFYHSLRTASPVDLPNILIQHEVYTRETVKEMIDTAYQDLQRTSLVEKIIKPVTLSIVDGILVHPRMRSVFLKTGLTSSRFVEECMDFSYESNLSRNIPDSYREHLLQEGQTTQWAAANRHGYVRKEYVDQKQMNRYKKSKIDANLSENQYIRDEYTNKMNVIPHQKQSQLHQKDSDFLMSAETDHIIPANTVYKESKKNIALSTKNIRHLANLEENYAITSHAINNAKGNLSNTEFIRQQKRLAAEGKNHLNLSPETCSQMIHAENKARQAITKETNTIVFNNLLGRGSKDAQKMAKQIHSTILKSNAKQTFFMALGDLTLDLIKPLFYELKDSVLNGFSKGVHETSLIAAFKYRINRIKTYLSEKIHSVTELTAETTALIKDFFFGLLESLLNMFVGIVKKAFRILKEGIKIFMQCYPILFGKDSSKYTAREKGDAITKIIGGSLMAVCGIGVDALLEQAGFIPSELRIVFSTILTGTASVVLFYLLDKVDLFNVQKERRDKRIDEICAERIHDIEADATQVRRETLRLMKAQENQMKRYLIQFQQAYKRNDQSSINASLLGVTSMLKIDLPYHTLEEFCQLSENDLIKWNL